jgi:hypothetical protein
MRSLLIIPVLFVLMAGPAHSLQGSDACSTASPIAGTGGFNYDCTLATTGTEGQGRGLCAVGVTTGIDNDVWFEWTSNFTGIVVVSTCGAPDDTKIAAYPGGGCPTQNTALACNDDVCGLQSTIRFNVVSGASYMLQLGVSPGTLPTAPSTFDLRQDVPVRRTANGHHYLIVQEHDPWDVARDKAATLTYGGKQGHLVTISDAAEETWVYESMAGALGFCWLGLYQDLGDPTYSEPSGGWFWVDGTPLGYANWHSGEPSNGQGAEHYAGFWSAGQWNDYLIDAVQVPRYVIEFDTPLPVRNPTNGHHYVGIDETVTWDEAEVHAQSMTFLGVPGHLATFTDLAEDQWVHQAVGGATLGDAWIGLRQDHNDPNYLEPAGGWGWIDGTPLNYTHWGAGEPNDSIAEDHCAQLLNGEWNDFQAGNTNVTGFIVEFDTPLPVEYAPTHHHYLAVPEAVSWILADEYARAMTYQGVQGHLATYVDAPEDAWVYSSLTGGILGNAWIGLFQDLNDPNYTEPAGAWKWVDGTPLTYTNWKSGEPNDTFSAEDWGGHYSAGQWNDFRLNDGTVPSYVVEFDNYTATILCHGDGSGTPCPCGNTGVTGEGCANSTGAGARLVTEGSPGLTSQSFTLLATGLPANQLGLFFQGNNAINAGLGIQFGDGLRCVGGAAKRLQIVTSDSTGTSRTTVDISSAGQVTAGDLRRYQLWYYDSSTACGALFNLSNAAEITWQP